MDECEDNQYHLQLNQFESTISANWKELQNDKFLSDVTLASDDELISAHKIVLCSNSPILKYFLKQHSNSNALIYLRGVAYKDLKNLIHFMYQGEVRVAKNDLDNFLQVAQDLKIRGLVTMNKSLVKEKYELEDEHFQDENKIYQIPNLNQPNVQLLDRKYDFNDISNIEDPLSDSKHQEMKNIEGYENPEDKQENVENNYYEKLETKQEKLVNSTTNVDHLNQKKKFTCKKCGKQYNNHASLSHHNLSTHEGIRYPCEKCSIRTTTKGDLKKHFNEVHGGIRFPCYLCDYVAKRKDKLKRHLSDAHESQHQENDNIDNKIGQNLEEKSDMSKDVLKFEDKNCDFNDVINNQDPFTDSQYQEKDNTEDINSESILINGYQNKEVKVENTTKGVDPFNQKKKLICKQCDKQYNTPAGLSQHNSAIHEGIRYPCDKCPIKSTTKTDLKKHMNEIHVGIKFPCYMCDYKTKRKVHLRRHLNKAHSQILPKKRIGKKSNESNIINHD